MAPDIDYLTSPGENHTPFHVYKLETRISVYPTEYPSLPKENDAAEVLAVDSDTPDNWVKRDPRLVRLTGKVCIYSLLVDDGST